MLNVFEAVDVIALIKGGSYDDLTLSMGEALQKRAPVGCQLRLITLSNRFRISQAFIHAHWMTI